MCVVYLPTFAPSPLRDAWGLHPPSRVGTRYRPSLPRTRRAGTRAPSALLRAAGLPLANHGDRTRPPGTRPQDGCGPASWSGPGARLMRAVFGHTWLGSMLFT
jgi:hypothetical protein